MSITKQKLAEQFWHVEINGRLDQSQTPALETMLTELLESGQAEIVVDLTYASYINSGGLRCLVSAWRKARQQNGNLVLCGLNQRLQDIFAMVGFDKVFRIYPDRDRAQQAMAA